MYNRYIPQPDGSYSRRRMSDSAPQRPRPQSNQQVHREPEYQPPEQPQKNQYAPPPQPRSYNRHYPQTPPQGGSVTGFLKNLIPKDFDTGDLLIVILLLLMSGDCPEDQNNALLTLALYLFM